MAWLCEEASSPQPVTKSRSSEIHQSTSCTDLYQCGVSLANPHQNLTPCNILTGHLSARATHLNRYRSKAP